MGIDKSPSELKWWQAVLILLIMLLAAGAFGWGASHAFLNIKR